MNQDREGGQHACRGTVTYQQSSLEINLDVVQPSDIQGGVDIIRRWFEHDLAAPAALRECLEYSRRVVSRVGSTGLDNTSIASSGVFCLLGTDPGS